MCGRATLAMVMSRMTMIIAAITEMVIRPLCFTSLNGSPSAPVPVMGATLFRFTFGFGLGLGSVRISCWRRSSPADWSGRRSPRRRGRSAAAAGLPSGSRKRTRTGTRCTTFTQLPVAFLRRQQGKLGAGAGTDRGDFRLQLVTRIGVDRDLRRLAGPHLGEVGFLEVGLDVAGAGLDQAHDGGWPATPADRPATGRTGRRHHQRVRSRRCWRG